MEDRTTRETSISLWLKGFKEPESVRGQKTHYYNTGGGINQAVYALTAIDILVQMPSTIGRQIRLSFGGETFCVALTEIVDGSKSETYFFNKNAAEALAEAYLHLKENEAPV